MSQYGISLYLGTGADKNREIIKKAGKAKVQYAFTSLHIPEERVDDYAAQVKNLLTMCRENSLSLIVDVGPRTLEKLGYSSFLELKQTSVSHLRVDYGFSYQQIVDLSQDFNIVFNASTMLEQDIRELQNLHADFSRFSACHNFYPKPLTGLSLQKTRRINENLKRLGITTMGFVPGDGEARGPLYEGLPTVEEHRGGDVLFNLLQLQKQCFTDVCLVGDVDLSETSWRKLGELTQNYVSLKAEILSQYSYVREQIHHDRPDSSEYVIRSQESRTYASQGKLFSAESLLPRPKGSILVGNEGYLRYSGELEIARCDLLPESRVNVVGHVAECDLPYLEYITDGMGFLFV
ncbi:MupG family TIM beta-alpha barrel fold protein [Oscillospiraceae bacterium PP1C4]